MSEEAQQYSTGRGGKGNFSASKSPELLPQKSTLSQLSASLSHDKDGNYIMSTGRGGALNLIHTSVLPGEPELEPTASPQALLQPVYSVGRGGYGNIKSNSALADSTESKPKGSLLNKVKKFFQ